MKFIDEFRDQALVKDLARRLGALAAFTETPATVMEVCGTHTMAAARFGLKSLLPPGVALISGPGCPVCVTDQSDLDAFLALGTEPGVVLVSFGDMLRVPGTHTSLEGLRAQGAEVRVVYSPLDAVELARQTPEKHLVFFGVGFETTMPATALAIQTAAAYGLDNFSVCCVHKTMPAALKALLSSGEVRVSGLLCPGHVTTIIGTGAYDFIPAEFGLPCAVTGFEPVDMLLGIESILGQLKEGKALRGQRLHPGGSGSRQPPGPGAAGRGLCPRGRRLAGPGRYPRQRRQDSGTLRPLRRPGPVPPGLGAPHPAAAVGLPLRRSPPGRHAPGGLPPVRASLHPGPTPGPLHGLHRRRLRRGVPV